MWMILVLTLLILIYLYGTRNFNYWKDRGVKYVKPKPFVGTNYRMFTQQVSPTDMLVEMYEDYPDEKLVGGFLGSEPGLALRDPELIKHVLSLDFAYFYSRGFNPHPIVIEPMLKNLFFADGDLWKLLRQRMTPAFTSGKLKAMFPLIEERAENLKKIATAAAAMGDEVDIRELMARYTTDFIGACGFGIKADSLNDDKSIFRKLGRRIFTIGKREAIITLLKYASPEIFKHLQFLAPEIENTTTSLVSSIMKERNYKPSGRNDFIDLLLELKDNGKIVGDSIEKKNPDGTSIIVELEFDNLLMAAQVFVFFAAGFETSSSATSYTLHQLAYNPDVQKRCQDEIDNVLKKHGNKLSYEAVNEMKYLDWTFREGMRMFPSLGFLRRRSVRQYTFPGTNVTIDPGVSVSIPVQALHNDEKYFPNPKEFQPERFSPENIGKIHKYTYLPFGSGPRTCIGERLGIMQSLAGLAALLSEFTVTPSRSSQRWPETDPTSIIVQSIKGGIPLALIARKK